MRDNLGLIHIYTGEGKGKTTAALGLALRARGDGLTVLIAQLFKSKSSELKMLDKIGVDYLQYSSSHPVFKKYSKNELAQHAKGCTEFVKRAFEITRKKKYDLLILDEIGPALAYNLVDANILIELIRRKPEHTELVLTGRGIPEKVITLAKQDYVTEMNKKAHPYDRGINARQGIEF